MPSRIQRWRKNYLQQTFTPTPAMRVADLCYPSQMRSFPDRIGIIVHQYLFVECTQKNGDRYWDGKSVAIGDSDQLKRI